MTKFIGKLKDKVRPPGPGGIRSDGTPVSKEDPRVYVAHGDIQWGNAISGSNDGEHEVKVYGWLARAPFPEPGDHLLWPMQSGKWGVYVFTNVNRVGNPNDMFTGRAVGAIDYHEAPKTKSPDEFIENLSPYFR